MVQAVELFREFLSSDFSAALLGAIVGAYGTHRATQRGEVKNELAREIRETDAAIALAFSVTESALRYKSQISMETVGAYRLRRLALMQIMQAVNAGIPNPQPIHLQMDARLLDHLDVPVARLEDVILKEISRMGRIAHLAITLTQVHSSLVRSIATYGRHVQEVRTSAANDLERYLLFYGIPNNGVLDETVLHMLDAVERQIDDLAWFGRRLVRELETHGRELRAEFKKRRFRGAARPITAIDFRTPERDGLFPTDENYLSWERAFINRIPTRSKRKRVAFFIRKRWRRMMGYGKAATTIQEA